ncbi:unnamed protein product [Vitrella brassicaformis CCMP3155]|uniref:Uncharacterized protein n=1 Tax=Vitrella brassicaformis (strain CCMP3155) TaxID=1169540 RepID=A0A0G4FJ88_VITBC|nr:unnamed protein product [Vitrella brassicaformis CCMP3155]|eukprot:CEM13116.1 unnamed protein product [Vitrella brassicaformis CCMP3155]
MSRRANCVGGYKAPRFASRSFTLPKDPGATHHPSIAPSARPREVPRKAGVIDPPPAPQLKQQKLAAPIPSLVPAAAAAAAAGQAQPPAPTTGNGDRIGQRIMGVGGDVADESTAYGAAMVTKELVPRRVDMCNLEKVGHVSRPSQPTMGGGRLLRPYPVHHPGWLRRCVWCGREA